MGRSRQSHGRPTKPAPRPACAAYARRVGDPVDLPPRCSNPSTRAWSWLGSPPAAERFVRSAAKRTCALMRTVCNRRAREKNRNRSRGGLTKSLAARLAGPFPTDHCDERAALRRVFATVTAPDRPAPGGAEGCRLARSRGQHRVVRFARPAPCSNAGSRRCAGAEWARRVSNLRPLACEAQRRSHVTGQRSALLRGSVRAAPASSAAAGFGRQSCRSGRVATGTGSASHAWRCCRRAPYGRMPSARAA